jgi:signal transduction histidine kinase
MFARRRKGHRDISLEVARGIHELRRGLRTTFSIQYPCHSPTQRRWFLLNATRLGERSPGPVLTLHEDITSLVLNQERLTSINSELARVAMFISHDVGAPLHTIQSYIELIRRNVGTMLEQSTAEYFDIVSATTSRLSTFVTEALNLALLGYQHQLPREQLDLDLVVQEAMQNIDSLIKEYGATVEVDRLGRAFGNFPYLVQLFQNLIGNAIIHSGQQARVHIGFSGARDRNSISYRTLDPVSRPSSRKSSFCHLAGQVPAGQSVLGWAWQSAGTSWSSMADVCLWSPN